MSAINFPLTQNSHFRFDFGLCVSDCCFFFMKEKLNSDAKVKIALENELFTSSFFFLCAEIKLIFPCFSFIFLHYKRAASSVVGTCKLVFVIKIKTVSYHFIKHMHAMK